jgi:hypothetical protein
MTTSNSSINRSTTATSAPGPRNDNSLPRTWTSTVGKARSIVSNSSSRGPSSVTIDTVGGMVMA